jgi:hypothetical protein
MLADHIARNRADCIAIGEHVYHHLERKGIKRGTLDLYVRKHFELRAEYLRRFIRVYSLQEALVDADAWQAATGWSNPYPYEPQRSCNLLTVFSKHQIGESSETGSTRKPFTESGGSVTDPTLQTLAGDCRVKLRGLQKQSIQMCITSVPYHTMRDFDVVGQIGLEDTVDDYVRTLVQDVFSQVRQVLRDDGVLIVNMGDRHSTGARQALKG